MKEKLSIFRNGTTFCGHPEWQNETIFRGWREYKVWVGLTKPIHFLLNSFGK